MVADAKARLSLDAKPFTDALRDAGNSAQKDFGKQLDGIASSIKSAFSIGAVVAFAQKIMSTADEVSNLSNRLGLSVETTQSLSVVAKEAGLSMGDFETAILKVTKNANEAVAGNEKMAEAFGKIGLSIDDIRTMSPETLFESVARAMATNQNNAENLTAIYDVLGEKAGPKLKSVLIELGTQGFGALNDYMVQSGNIMSENAINTWDAFGDKLAEITRQLQSLAGDKGTPVLQFILDLGAAIDSLASGMNMTKAEVESLAASSEQLAEIVRKRQEDEIARQQELQALYDKRMDLNAQLLAAEEKLAKVSGEQLEPAQELIQLKQREAELEDVLSTVFADNNETLTERIAQTNELATVKTKIASLEKALSADEKAAATDLLNAQRDLLTAQERYNKARFDGLSDAEKLKELEWMRVEAAQAILDLEEQGKGNSKEWYDAKTNLLSIEKDMAALADKSKEKAVEAKQITADQVEKMRELRDVFKDMTEQEVNDFIKDMQHLAGELGKIGAMDLGWITQLSSFKFNSLTSGQARQMVRAFQELVNGLQNVQVPQGMKDLFEGLGKLGAGGPGRYHFDLTVPKGWEKGMILEPNFDATLKSIDGSLKTLANLKGVVWA